MRLAYLPVLAATLALLLCADAANAEGVRVLRSDESVLEVELTIGEIRWESVPGSDGRTFRRPSTAGAIHQARPGEPDLPSVIRLVGLPPEGSARVRVLSVETVSERVADLAPAPEPALDEEKHGFAREKRTALVPTAADQPEAWAELGDPLSLRGRRFARLVLHPFRYSASRGEVTQARRLVVRVDFEGPPPARSAPPRMDSWERCLDESLLNADVARGWRVAEPVRRGGGDSFDSAPTWLRVPMTQSGVYLLDYFTFANAGVDPAQIDPRTVRVFSGTNLPLREPYDVAPPDFMTENALLYLDDDAVPDGVFDIDDRFLFYALSAHGWANEYDPARSRTEFVENPYGEVTYYWIAWGNGFAGPAKRMNTSTRTVTPTGATPVTAAPHRVHFEENNVEDFDYRDEDGWQWESLQGRGTDRLYTVGLDNVASSGDGVILARMLSHGATTESTQREVELKVGSTIVADSIWSHSGNRAVVDMQGCFQNLLVPGTNAIRVNAKKVLVNSTDRIYTTWFDVEYNRNLVAKGGSWLKFWSAPAAPPGVDSLCTMYDRYGQTSFLVQGLRTTRPGQEIFLLDVTDQHDVVRLTGYFTLPVPGTTNLWDVSFSDPGQAGTRWYVATTLEGVLPLAAPEIVQLAGLRSPANGAEYVVIYHPRFQEGAERLAAIRRDLPGAGLSTLAVNINDVYNEFSWGQVDPVAVRDFLAFTFAGNWQGGGPVYVVLVGDAAYDTKQFLAGSPENLLGTYTGRYRTEPFVQYTSGDNINFYPTDDFFGYLETADYALGAQLGLDIAIGRYPVKQPEDFDLLLDKLDEYTKYESPGQWQNRMIMAADDERTLVDTAREPWHTQQVETLARERVPSAIDKVKVYLTEYPRNDFGKKPDGQDTFIDEFTRGALMVTYTGHGDQNTLAQEEVFVAQKVAELLNEDRYSVFSTFSCTVSRYDLLSGDSMTELLLAHPDGGTVTTFSSAGLVFPQQSSILNQEWLGAMFGTPYPINTYARAVHSIGLSALWAKAIISTTVSDRQNCEKYVLLGDPALEVRFGRHLIEFDATTIDTQVTDGLLRVVRGSVMSQSGQVLDGTAGTTPFN
ncbi:MAG: C25 family cysteine peptidase, partial [Candidatus Eiseniibacteriota bacterium]